MDEDLAIIDSNTRNEKIKNFFIKNKMKLIIFLSFLILVLLGYFGYDAFKNKKIIEISNLYNSTIIEYSEDNKNLTKKKLIDIINQKDPTYSPLSLYFIIDNRLILDRKEMNDLFNIIIDKTSLEHEIKNLIIYKKALYNADFIEENDLLDILDPLVNSRSIWRSHALYLLGEYFYSKKEKQKSKEFFQKILEIENANQDLIREAQKRLNRDLSD